MGGRGDEERLGGGEGTLGGMDDELGRGSGGVGVDLLPGNCGQRNMLIKSN